MSCDDVPTLAARATRTQDPTEGLAAVARLRALLDRLEAHHVDRALQRGLSWSQIGRSLGVSKQAAHRKHANRDSAPFVDAAAGDVPEEPRVVITGPARTVVARARDEAAAHGEAEVRPAHLLAALLQSPAGPAQDALAAIGLDLDDVRPAFGEDVPKRKRFARRPGIAAATRAVLERSLAESQRLCHGHIGPEHLLLALLREQDGPALELLHRSGATTEDVERAICDVLKHTDFARSL